MDLHTNLEKGYALHQQGKLAEAEQIYSRILEREPKNFDALHLLGLLALQTHRTQHGVELISKAIAINSGFAPAYINLGNGLRDLKRSEEAVTSCDRAIALMPNLAEAYSTRGNALLDLKRYEEALISYDRAISLKPDYAEAYNNRGSVLQDLNRIEEALASYDRAIALKPDYAEAYSNRGLALQDLRRFQEALVSFDRAFTLKPNLSDVEGQRLKTKMHLCDWSNFDTACVHVISSVRNRNVSQPPFTFLAIPSSSDDQLRCAKLWVANNCPPSEKPIWQGERYDHHRIRIAYLSADFHSHPTAYLMAELFERHDRSQFETIGVSFGIDDRSETRRRLVAGFDEFHDVQRKSDKEVARLLYDRQIDVAIDLKGYTQNMRFGIFVYRPVPIQVNYLGYPGTMGTRFIDYIIADKVVAPIDHQQFYSEKIVHLPDCYQVNDSKRKIAESVPTRQALGLPQEGFVFCCFNDNYKILPHIFDIWMKILKRVEGSVLWLLEDNATAAANLRKEAVARGVAAERLIFAKRAPLPEHLARHRCADLFLDTLPCNAHTTASDALWAGLPVLTCRGETFAGRVAASLLAAIHLPELATENLADYERLELELAANPEKLADIKRKLAGNRLTTPLFDTKSYTKHLEAAYAAMHERHRAGLAPDHIVVPN